MNFRFEPHAGRLVFHLNSREAKGAVGIETAPYGLYIYVEGFPEPVALIDLYYLSEEARREPDSGPAIPQLVIYNGDGGDPVAFARFYPQDGARIAFEVGVQPLPARDHFETVFGYPLRDS